MADIKQSVFNQSVALYLITSQDSMLQAARLSLYTPFSVSEEYQELEVEQATTLYKNASEAALNLLSADEIMELISRERNGELVQGELLLFFDCLL